MDRSTKFRCLPLACTMAVGVCADRQRDATVSLARNRKGDAARFTPFDRASRIRAARGRGLAIAQANRRARTTCGKGHPYPEGVTFDRNGGRICRQCLTENNRAYRARKRAA